jgi:hypothetical protein
VTCVALVVPPLRHRQDSQSAILKLSIPSRCSGEGGQWGEQAASAAGRVCGGAPSQGRSDDPARRSHGADQERSEDHVRLCAAVRAQPGQTRRRNGHAQQEAPHAGGQAGEGKIHCKKRAAGERPHVEARAALQEGEEAAYCASIGCSVLLIHVVKAVHLKALKSQRNSCFHPPVSQFLPFLSCSFLQWRRCGGNCLRMDASVWSFLLGYFEGRAVLRIHMRPRLNPELIAGLIHVFNRPHKRTLL